MISGSFLSNTLYVRHNAEKENNAEVRMNNHRFTVHRLEK